MKYKFMIEYLTEALVLDKKDFSEMDSLIYFYTEELGKVSGKLKSAKRILSKSNAHLEPVHFVKVRLMLGRNGNFQVIDAMPFKKNLKKEIKKCPEKLAKHIRISNFIKEMTFESHVDRDLWKIIKDIFLSNIEEVEAYKMLLKRFGFDTTYAGCSLCSGKKISFFCQKDQLFFCHSCVPNKVLENEFQNSQLIKIT